MGGHVLQEEMSGRVTCLTGGHLTGFKYKDEGFFNHVVSYLSVLFI